MPNLNGKREEIFMRRNEIVRHSIVSLALMGLVSITGCKKEEGTNQTGNAGSATTTQPASAEEVSVAEAPALPDPPQGLDKLATPSPESNPNTPEKVALGELLFFDTRLSDNGELACVTCHQPEKAWTDGKPLSPKPDGKLNTRHSPTMYNVGYASDWYWDGRKKTLEDQILAAWQGQVGGTAETVIAKLERVPEYRVRFKRAFNEGPTAENIPKALASFLRLKLRAGDAAWDHHEAGQQAVPEDVIKGHALFTGKAGCALCHAPPLYTDMAYHNVGIGYRPGDKPDEGRFATSKVEAEKGAFKTPGLRGVELSAPYFHDGSVATLEEAVDFMLAGGHRDGNPNIDPRLKPVTLSAEERAQLIAFIKALTPLQTYEPPKLP
jgi:cytochrome c peroxidase